MSRKFTFAKLILLMVVLVVASMMLGNEPWGPI
jgi:hypothetical protein